MHATRLVALGLAAVLATALQALPAGAQTPNHSILFYQPGRAVTGMLKQGAFTQKRSFTLRKVTAAAATRDSLALYDKATGKLRTGTFRKGVYRHVKTITIRPGFTHAAGSCDSVLFYNTLTGRALAGTLVSGRFRDRTLYQIGAGWTTMVASCDTAWITDAGGQVSMLGALSGGDWVQHGPTINPDSFSFSILAATRDSVLSLAGNFGIWGTLTGGTRALGGNSSDFAVWDRVAGTATTLQFYRADGLEARAVLLGGAYGFVGASSSYRSGWRIIVGGR